MNNETIQDNIELSFREQAINDSRLKNAYLLVHSPKLNIDLNIAQGNTDDMPAHPSQPNHLASVGKIFTATLIGILFEKGLIDYEDKISKYLDEDLLKGLHIFKGKDYSYDISVKHLLMQTSGLDDVFYHLWGKIIKDNISITPKESVVWGKENLKPKSIPGEKHTYGDTNYYLLGLIIESILNISFFEAIHKYIFRPLDMKHAYMNYSTEPDEQSAYPTAKLYIDKIDALSIPQLSSIDYAGGSVVAPLDEFLLFMKSLVNNHIIKQETLHRMINDDINMGFPLIGFNYGYSIWKVKHLPIILPKDYSCWGCVGVTGAFMFYHPKTDSYIIGSFNDTAYTSKAIRFMLNKVVKELLKANK